MTLSETVQIYKTCAAAYVAVGIVVAIVIGKAWLKIAFETPMLQALMGQSKRLRFLLYAMITAVSATLAAGWPTGLVAYMLLKVLGTIVRTPRSAELSGELTNAQQKVLSPSSPDDDRSHAIVHIVNAMVRTYGPVQARRLFESIIENWEAFVEPREELEVAMQEKTE